MKFIHTADWHLGNTFHGHDRETEGRHFLNWLVDVIRLHAPDALLVTGDVFDSSNPPASAEALYYEFLRAACDTLPGLQVVVTAGNHDSPRRIEAPAPLLGLHDITVRGTVPQSADGTPDIASLCIPLRLREAGETACYCWALPFLRAGDAPNGANGAEALSWFYDGFLRAMNKSGRRRVPCIATGHFYTAGAEICANEHSERLVVGGSECVNVNVLSDAFSYIALGHIHKAQCVSNRPAAYYAGSALPMSFSEKRYEHGVNLVEIGAEGQTRVTRLPYTPLRSLISIPQNGAASPDAVRYETAKLPERKPGDDGRTWPYLEIRVVQEQPEPELMADISHILSQKAVHFCRMTAERHDTDEREPELTVERLKDLTPLDMAQRVYKEQYGDYLPEPMETRLRATLEEVAAEG
ncbi:MAG: exonuclease SbcCD subunit D C-terminal domain-containing protein [Bacteroidaceae bacterium]|nr:exonuclease SbcCD subunit D C-terminal domain-containing protein [Bacteroidaceae bacterium]